MSLFLASPVKLVTGEHERQLSNTLHRGSEARWVLSPQSLYVFLSSSLLGVVAISISWHTRTALILSVWEKKHASSPWSETEALFLWR